MSGRVNIEDLGAVPDNRTNCSPMIQQILDAKETPYIPSCAGRYRCDDPIYLSIGGQSIVGDGYQSNLRHPGGDDPLFVMNSHYNSLRDLRIIGAPATTILVAIAADRRRNEIVHCRLSKAMVCIDDDGYETLYHRCLFDNHEFVAIQHRGTHPTLRVSRCYFTGPAYHANIVSEAHTTEISDCVFGQGARGILLQRAETKQTWHQQLNVRNTWFEDIGYEEITTTTDEQHVFISGGRADGSWRALGGTRWDVHNVRFPRDGRINDRAGSHFVIRMTEGLSQAGFIGSNGYVDWRY